MSRITGIPPGKQGKAQRKKGMNTLVFGVASNSSNGHSATWTGSKVKADRSGIVEFIYNEVGLLAHVKTGLATSYADGCLPCVLVEPENSVFLANIVPATYAKAVREVVETMRSEHPGQPYYVVELCNEPYNDGEKGSNASDYAALCKASYEAVEAAGIPLWPAVGGVMLLCAAHLTYQKKTSEKVAGAFSDYTTGGGWLKDFREAWPESLSKVNGWTSHPYGSPTEETSHEGNNNIPSAKTQHEQAVLLGFNATGCNNWWVTEFGYNVNGSSGGTSVINPEEQAVRLREALEKMLTFHREGWLKAALVFADGLAGYGIWERPAAGVLQEIAKANG